VRILFVTLPRNPYAARHINQVARRGWEVHVFPGCQVALLPGLDRGITVH
jgi:hypothetical protein